MKYKFILVSPWLLKCPDNRDPKRDHKFDNHPNGLLGLTLIPQYPTFKLFGFL